MKYLIARTAKKNPDIAGRTLYLSTIGLWTLDKENARKFDRAEADKLAKKDADYRVVKA